MAETLERTRDLQVAANDLRQLVPTAPSGGNPLADMFQEVAGLRALNAVKQQNTGLKTAEATAGDKTATTARILETTNSKNR